MSDDLELDEWVAGFFNSEGGMEAKVRERERNTIGYSVNPSIDISQTSKSFVSGMIDGDGCIELKVQKVNYGKTRHEVDAKFRMVQTGMGSLEEMIRLSRFCESINVDYSISEIKFSDDKKNNGYRFSVATRDGVQKFLKEIGDCLCFSKRHQAKILLRRIIPMMNDDKHLNKEGFLEIMAWRDLMNSFKGGNRGKYDLEYFEKEWDMELSEEKKPDVEIEDKIGQYKKETVNKIREW